MSVPLSSRWVAKLCRSVCTVTRLPRPDAAHAERQAACSTVALIECFGSRPGNSQYEGLAIRQYERRMPSSCGDSMTLLPTRAIRRHRPWSALHEPSGWEPLQGNARLHRHLVQRRPRYPASHQMNLESPHVLQIKLVRRGAKKRPNFETACTYDRWVAGDRLRTVMSSIMRRRSGLISAIGGLRSSVGVKHPNPGRPNNSDAPLPQNPPPAPAG